MASTPVGSNAIIMEVLDRNNYEDWRPRVKIYLLAEDLWKVIEANGKPQKAEDDQAENEAWTKKNAKALYAIQNSCGREMFSFIKEIETAKNAWEVLEQECKVFQGYDETNVHHLARFKSFIESVKSGDWDKAKKCLGEVDIRSVLVKGLVQLDNYRKGSRTLHVAALEGHAHIVKELVQLMTQDDLKTQKNIGHTALHLAAAKGHLHVVKKLPVALMGEVKDEDGDTALHIAVQEGKVDVVKELVMLMREEDLKIKNDAGYTALHLAVNKGDMPMLKEFVTKREGTNNIGQEEDFERYVPFTQSVIDGDWDKANECLRKLDDPCGAITAVDPRDGWGHTALHMAAWQGHLGVTKGLVVLLKKREEDLELKTAEDFTTFGAAITLEVSEEVLMERAKYMVDQWEKTLGRILEMPNAEGFTALHTAVFRENVEIVKEVAPLMRQEGLELKNADGDPALHFAASWGKMDIVKELMSLMRPKAFEEKDGRGFTVLDSAIYTLKDGEVCEIAKFMAENNNKVFGIPSAPFDEIPVVTAARHRKWEMARYIYALTPLGLIDGPNGSALICLCLETSKQLDLAWDLLHRHPNLAITVGEVSPMLKLSRTSYAFLSGTQMSCWRRWIYNRIHIEEVAPVNIHDIFISVAPSEDDHENKRNFLTSVTNLIRQYARGLLKLCGIQGLYEMKSTHKRVLEILQCMGEATKDALSRDQLDMVKTSFFKAIQHGHFEFVTHICKANPELLRQLDGGINRFVKGIFHSAIESRQKEVYSLIYELEEGERRDIGLFTVNEDYNLLHYAANLSSLPQFDLIQDAGLQMQRELQWFMEVESVVTSEVYEQRNRSDDMTARELFTKNHKKLMEDAEVSIKKTATSCTVVGALIVTMMFAAAFTVPGGNDGNTGLPLKLHHKLFKVYIVSDTVSLVSSISSVITFLGLLTSRYAENDYLKSLPTKIMIGLVTLFSSIVSMMVAFSCALIIQLDGDAWNVMLSILFTSVPVMIFVWLLFPLLFKTFMSTYGPGIFDKKKRQ